MLDRVTSMTSPVGTTKYHYDDTTGRLDEIETPQGKKFHYSYEHGQLASLQYPNGITANYNFDVDRNLTLIDYVKDAVSLRHYRYTYGNPNCSCKGIGMRSSMEDIAGLHEYGYDEMNRIIRATHPTTVNPLEQFTYDSSGNRMAGDGDPFECQYNELNQLGVDDSASYDYDADGNLAEWVVKATGDTTHFSWDVENRLREVRMPGKVVTYSYDALGRRTSKTVNGETKRFHYDRENLILEMNADGIIEADYTFGPGIDNPLSMERDGLNYLYVKDGLGSVTALADSDGRVVHEYAYSVFGKVVEESGSPVENPFAFTSRELDRETGLMFYRARYYSPQMGRFLSEDPIGLKGGKNIYVYARNNPLTYRDPSGLLSECATKAASAFGTCLFAANVAIGFGLEPAIAVCALSGPGFLACAGPIFVVAEAVEVVALAVCAMDALAVYNNCVDSEKCPKR